MVVFDEEKDKDELSARRALIISQQSSQRKCGGV